MVWREEEDEKCWHDRMERESCMFGTLVHLQVKSKLNDSANTLTIEVRDLDSKRLHSICVI